MLKSGEWVKAPDGATLLDWAEQAALAIQRSPGPLGLAPDLRQPTGQETDPGDDLCSRAPAADIYRLGRLLYGQACGGEPAIPPDATGPDDAGLTPQERKHFRRAVLMLFGGDPNATLVLGGRRGLPDLDYNAGRLTALLERLTAPAPEARPAVAEVLRGIEEIRSALQPRIDSLTLRVTPETVRAEETASVELIVTGVGLPTHDRWLNLTLDGNPLSAEVESPAGDYLNGEGIWRYRWTAGIDDEGARRLAARCWAGDHSPQGEVQVRVLAAPEQFWRAGRREAAVEREPREEWLDQMQREAAAPPRQAAFHELLARLGNRFPDNVLLRARLDRLEGRGDAPDRLEPLKRGLGALYKRYRTLLVDGVDLGLSEEDFGQVREIMARKGLPPGETAGFIKDLRARQVLGLIAMTGELLLGHNADADVVMACDAVSGKHARLGWDPVQRGFWIEDMQSSNGTWWGRNERLRPGRRYPLEPGRLFYLADQNTPLAAFVLSLPVEPDL